MKVALALPLDDERRLTASAGFHGHEVVAVCSGGDELAVRIAQVPVELAVVAATPEHLTPRLVESADLLGVRMLVVADDATARRHAERTGIIDAVDGPADWALLGGGAPAVAAAPAAPDDAALPPVPISTARRPGVVLAVWGPHGAPGRTSIAIGLAAEFAAAGLRVVLADADTHAAAVAPALGLLDEAPGFAAACRLAGIGGLDETQFERLAQPHRASRHPFRVLTGIGRPSRWPELGEERVAGVLAAARACCDVLVVDLGASLERDEELAADVVTARRNAAALEVLRHADRVVAVAAGDPVGIARFLRSHAELGELVEPDRIEIVVNKVRASAIGLNPGGQLRQTLARFGGIEDAVLVPWDPAAFDAAVLSGRAIADAAPRSAARAGIRELATRLVPTPAAAGVRGRRGRRLA
ncbi:AAA family ATPase [Protaetiibacter intestinalis]|uniref:AAA family ATPase n=1 Tax=Protaetiibacter intestinalis TaxID=2419774 RepID=UPI001D03D2E7|nr:regulator [Protaetiibacter intestinalis]